MATETPDAPSTSYTLPTVQVEGYTLRELPREEWGRLAAIPGPLQGRDLRAGDAARIIVIESPAGAIVSYWPAFAMVHLDLLYTDAEVRHHPKVQFALVGAMATMLQQLGVTHVCAVVADADQPANGQMAEKLGLAVIPGALYMGAIPPPAEEMP